MTALLIIVVLGMAAALTALGLVHFRYRARRPSRVPVTGARRILFPFLADALSPRALDASLRLAHAEGATLVPAFLARVSMHLPLDTPLPRQSNIAIPMQEAIEQRATAFGVPVDARIERGRTPRHALRQAITNERFDRIVIAAATREGAGFGPDDVAWLLNNTSGEIAILRPGENEEIMPSAGHVRRRTPTRSRARKAAG